MFLEQVPQADWETTHIFDISDNGFYIDMGISDALFREMSSTSWMKAFQEHYNLATNNSCECKPYAHSYGRAIKIPPEKPQIEFCPDPDHRALKFWVNEDDEPSREIVYSFLERVFG